MMLSSLLTCRPLDGRGYVAILILSPLCDCHDGSGHVFVLAHMWAPKTARVMQPF